ncbi:hypothetical protein A6U88_33830 [Agrobacterium sp. B131/95]|nr:hypothetical protein A6U88_33830 [Agrobacterium sp. B131/95]
MSQLIADGYMRRWNGILALRLSKATSTSHDFWLNLQRAVDIYDAQLKLKDELSALEVLSKPTPEAELLRDLSTD